MKLFFKLGACMAATLLLGSCIKDEPLNAEADILSAAVHVDNPGELFYHVTDTERVVPSAETTITFTVKRKADVSALAPRFALTDGATIQPANGSVQDFSNGPVVYTVTSQDGAWTRRYEVAFEAVARMERDTVSYDFEHFELTSLGEGAAKYYAWKSENEDGTLGNDWATGNGGFSIAAWDKSPEEFPSVPEANGYDGYGVKLTTRSTGALGAMMNMRLAAGNLFYGDFDLENAVMDPLHATRFGKPFDRKPLRFTGYYKYQPGKEFWDKTGHVLARPDSADVYAVFYRNHDDRGNAVTLDGENVKTSELIVAMADMGYVKPVDEWTEFDVTFAYSADIDLDVLSERGYSLALVFSSSKDGASFLGAPGSTLYIDKVKVICEKEDE